VLGKQALSLGRGRCWSGQLRSQKLEVLLHCFADIPRIFDKEDI
jgi:hypothetical protein